MDFTRQRDWFDPSRINAACTIVGAGGIGSFTALALAKLGIQRLNLVDFDDVEPHNIPNQLFGLRQAGGTKVGSLRETISYYAGAEDEGGPVVVEHEQPLQDGIPLAPVVISALDSMEARADLWQQVRYKFNVGLFLDGRLGGQSVVLYAVNPTNPVDVDGYEATLHSDDEGLELPCTARSIIDVGFAVASLITRATRRHFTHQEVDHVTYLNQETLTIMKGAWS